MRTMLDRRGLRAGIGVLFIPASVGLGVSQVAGQDRRPPDIPGAALDSVRRRIESTSPTSGPPGTTVTLRTGGLPAVTPMRIGIGAIRFGFEEIGQVMTDVRGEFSMTVTVPAWARRDVTHYFIVFDFYFVPIALSRAFHVTGADGTVQRAGLIAERRVECSVLRADDGITYALLGDTHGFAVGDQVVVEGTIPDTAACGVLDTIAVVRARSPT